VLFPSSAGTYAAIVSSARCLDTTACINWSPLGISAISNAGIQLFPSPSAGLVHVTQSGIQSIERVDLIDLSGKLLRSETIENDNFTLDFTQEPAGLYFIKIQTDVGLYIEKMIFTDK